MTMPQGSVEEPDASYVDTRPFAVHVASSDAKPEKSVGTEFGYWRTLLINNQVGQDTATPGARRLCNRSERRRRLLIAVAPTINPSIGGQSVSVTNTAAAPGVNGTVASIGAAALDAIAPTGGTWVINWSTELIGPVADPTDRNNMYLSSPLNTVKETALQTAVAGTVPQAPYTLIRNAGQGINVQAVGAATAATTYGAQISATLQATAPQPVTDGVIVGNRDFISNSQQVISPFLGGLGGGFIPVGQSLRWECQAELWAAFPPSNASPVLVTISDEVYAVEMYEPPAVP